MKTFAGLYDLTKWLALNPLQGHCCCLVIIGGWEKRCLVNHMGVFQLN